MKMRVSRPSGMAHLNVVTRFTPEDQFLCGRLHVAKGWHWWFEAEAPDGTELCGVTKGPFETEEAALEDATSKGAFSA